MPPNLRLFFCSFLLYSSCVNNGTDDDAFAPLRLCCVDTCIAACDAQETSLSSTG